MGEYRHWFICFSTNEGVQLSTIVKMDHDTNLPPFFDLSEAMQERYGPGVMNFVSPTTEYQYNKWREHYNSEAFPAASRD